MNQTHMTRSILAWLAALSVVMATGGGCRSSNFHNQRDAGADAQVATHFGLPCVTDDDCGTGGLTCAHPLGVSQPGICTVVGCPTSPCPDGGSCIELGLPDLPSLCVASTSTDDPCANQCGTALRCSLDPNCFDLGCCGRQECPPHCAQLSPTDCALDGRCPADCCP